MPVNATFRGDAVAVAQVDTITIGGTPAAGQIYTATINGKDVSYTAILADTNTLIATALTEALNSTSTVPQEFTEATYTSLAGVITAVAATAGVPFEITSSATGTGTAITASVTASSGPNHWDAPSNWSTGAVPVTGDTVYLRGTSVSILYGLPNSGVTLALLDIDSSYTGKIGNNDFNTLGYYEYRDTYLTISATIINIGAGVLSGPGRVRVNVGSNLCTLNVYTTGSPDDSVSYAVDFIGTHASNVFNITRGTVGIGMAPGVASTIVTARVGSKDSPANDANVYFGASVTLGTVTMSGGQVVVNNGLTLITLTDGTLHAMGGAFAQIKNHSGVVNYETAGALSIYYGGTKSTLNCSRNPLARTIAASTFEAQSSFLDPLKTVTFTAPALINCKLSELGDWDVGEQFGFQRS